MAELATPVPYQLKIPDDNSFYQPTNLPFRNWSPADFESALQFGPKPVPIDAYSDIAKSIGNTVGEQFNPSYQLQRQEAQDRLANYNDPNNPSNPNAPANAIRDTTANLPTANLSDRPGVPNLAGSQVAPPSSPNTPNLAGYPAPASAPTANRPLPTVPASQVGAVSNASAPDADGWHMTLGTTFATPNDLADFAKNHSLATGDNGIGLNGTNTATSTPYVALPPSTLRAYGIDPAKALGTPVTVQANGKTVQAVVADHLPDNAKNGAGIDLNPGTATALGIDDVNNFKGQVAFKLGYDGPSTAPVFPSDAPPTVSGSPAKGMLTATLPSIAPAAPAAVPNAPLFGFQPNVAPAPNLPTLSLPRDTPDGAAAASSVVNKPLVAIGADPSPAPKLLALPATEPAPSRVVLPGRIGPLAPVGSSAPVSNTGSATTPILAPPRSTAASPAAGPGVLLAPPASTASSASYPPLLLPHAPAPSATMAPAPVLVPPGATPLSDAEMQFTRSPLSKGEVAAHQPTFLQKMAAVYGPGHATQTANGSVSYETNAPLNPLQQAEVNLMPLTTKLKQQELAQMQQKLNQDGVLFPLQAQAEQAKIALAQRQFEAAQQAAQNSHPIVVPGADASGASGGMSAASDPETPFAPGHILYPMTVTSIKDGVPEDASNPSLSSALSAASSHGAKVNEHMTVIGGRPYVDMTSLYAASGADAQSMREQTAQFGQKYLMAQSAADAAKAYLDPKVPKNGAGDTQFINSVLQTEAPGTVPNADARKQIAEKQGWGDWYETTLHKATTGHDPSYLSETQRQDLANAAQASTQAKANEYLTFAKSNIAGVAAKAMQAASSKAAPASAPSTTGMVKMTSPTGAVGYIPQANVTAATAKGFTIAQ